MSQNAISSCAPIPAGWSVIMGRKRVAQQILCKVSAVRPESGTDTANSLRERGFAVSSTFAVPKNPLHLVISRTPVFCDTWQLSTYYLDTLDCGHQVAIFPQNCESGKKRHRCAICGEAQMALKFYPQSVPSPRKKRLA